MKQINKTQWIIVDSYTQKELLVTLPKGSVDQVGWERNNSNELLAILDTDFEYFFQDLKKKSQKFLYMMTMNKRFTFL